MSWPQWPGGGVPQPGVGVSQSGVLQTPIINPAPNVVNPAAPVMPAGQYTPEQWAQMQQQNWQQWAQWQQQFQQWQQQYGAEYQKSMTAIAQTRATPVQPPVPFFNNAPPPLPAETKPPPPPDDPHIEPFQQSNPAPYPSFTSAPPPIPQPNFSNAPPPPQGAPPKEQFQNKFNPNHGNPPPNQGGFPIRNRNEGFNDNQQRYGGNQNYANNRGRNMNWQNQSNRNQPSFNENRFNQQQGAPNEMENRNEFGMKRPYSQPNDGGDPKRNKMEPNIESNRWKGNQQKQRWGEAPPSNQSENQQWDSKPTDAAAKANPEELTEAEKKFDKQFAEWESQFQKWKEQNANHPDKEQYREYEKKWEAWRSQLLDRREQMRRKRLGLASGSPQPPSDKPSQSKPENAQQKGLDCPQASPQTGDDKLSQGKSGPSQIGPQTFPPSSTGKSNVTGMSPQMPNLGTPPPNTGKPSLLGTPPLIGGKPTIPQQHGSKQPLLATSGFPMPPPNLNNQPLEFKKSNPEFDEKAPTQNELLPDSDDAAPGFLKSASTEGIPGLDLVKDAKDDDKTDEQTKEQKDSENSKPDLEAISRGINSILGDQKLMNMLSLVSQNQSRPVTTNAVNTVSSIRLESPKFSPEPYHQEEYDEYSNQEDTEFYGNKNQNLFSHDEQTRSSFNVGNEGDLDKFNPEFENPGRDADYFDGKSNEFSGDNGDFQENSDDRFNRGPNMGRGPNNWNRGPDNFNRGPDNFNRGPDNFNRGPDHFNRGPNNFNRGPDNFNRGPPNFSKGPDNINRGADGVNRGPDSINRGPGNFNRGPDDFNRGGPNDFNRGRDNFNMGPDNFNRGPDNFNRNFDNLGPDGFNRGPDNLNSRGGPGLLNRGPDNFNRVPDNFNRGPDNFSRGPGNFDRDPGGFNRFPDNLNKGPGNFNRGPDNFNRGPDNFNRGPDNFNRGPDNFNRGPDNFNKGPTNVNRGGPDGFNRGPNWGSDNFNKVSNFDKQGPNSFNRESDNFNKAADEGQKTFNMRESGNNFDGNSDRFGRGPDNFTRGPRMPGNFNEEPNSFDREQENFNRAPQSFDKNNFNMVPDNQNDTVESDRFQPPEGEWNRNNSFPNDPNPPEPSEVKNDQPVVEEEIWKPNNVTDYDHKSLKSTEPDVILESLHTFDYRHKPLNRIPYPQRPKWLSDMVKNYPEFDLVMSRPFEPQQLRRYPVNERFDNYQKYEDRDRKPYDDRDRKPYDDRARRPYDVRDRKPYEERDRKPFEDRDRKPFDDRDRKPFEDRDRKPYDDRDRKSYDDSFRKSFDGKPSDERRPRDFDDRRFPDDQKFFGGKKPYSRDSENRRNEDQHENMEEGPSFRDKKQNKEQQGKGEDNQFGSDKNINLKNAPSNVMSKSNITLIEDLLSPPGRFNRPPRVVIILRGPPGSGKSFLAKLIKDKEVESGGSAPRILCLDDYFMVEQEKEVEEEGRKVKVKEMVYEYEECMEASYRQSLMKAFKKTITDGYFNFIIVDNINDKVKYFGEMWSFAKQNGFQVYICQMELDVQTCTKRNVHARSEVEIERCVAGWEQTPTHHPVLDATSLIQSGSIPEVEMEEINSPASENMNEEERLITSKWDNFDYSIDNLAKLDGTNKPLRPSRTMEDYLQLDDEWIQPVSTKPGQKRVRWADLEERKKQEKMRAIGFVVGQTNWDRMMDPTMGSGALTQTKYIERYNKY